MNWYFFVRKNNDRHLFRMKKVTIRSCLEQELTPLFQRLQEYLTLLLPYYNKLVKGYAPLVQHHQQANKIQSL